MGNNEETATSSVNNLLSRGEQPRTKMGIRKDTSLILGEQFLYILKRFDVNVRLAIQWVNGPWTKSVIYSSLLLGKQFSQ